MNKNESVVSVAVDQFKGLDNVRHEIKITERMEQLMKKNFDENQDEPFFQYFGMK